MRPAPSVPLLVPRGAATTALAALALMALGSCGPDGLEKGTTVAPADSGATPAPATGETGDTSGGSGR